MVVMVGDCEKKVSLASTHMKCNHFEIDFLFYGMRTVTKHNIDGGGGHLVWIAVIIISYS